MKRCFFLSVFLALCSKSLYGCGVSFKDPFSGLRQFLANESPLEVMKNTF